MIQQKTRPRNAIGIPRLLLTFLVIGVIMMFADDVRAAEATENTEVDESTQKHVWRIFDGLRVIRWESPIRYQMLGITTQRHVDLFHNTVSRMADLTGVDIKPGSDGREMNTWFLFSPDFRATAKIPAVRNLLKLAGESDRDFDRRVSGWPDDSLSQIHRGMDGGKFRYFAALVNPLLVNESALERLFMTIIYQSLANIDHYSDFSEGSIMNTGRAPLKEPSEVDLKIIRLIYDSKFPFRPDDDGGKVTDLLKMLAK